MNNEEGSVETRTHIAGTTTERVATRVQDTAERIKSSAAEQIDVVKQRAESGRDHAAERIRRVGTALRGVGQELRGQDDAFVAKYADSISEGIDSVATYVAELEAQALVADATRFARSRPAWFFGGAFLVGLAAGRFLKSSRPVGGAGVQYRQPAPEPYSPRARPSFPSPGSSSPDRNISTRGVFDTDERSAP